MKTSSEIYDGVMSWFNQLVSESTDIDPDLPKCVRCGYCCMQKPCSFGHWNYETERCEFLVWDEKENCYGCGIIEEIKAVPAAIIDPAFGAGCCSPNNNPQRELFKEWNQTKK